MVGGGGFFGTCDGPFGQMAIVTMDTLRLAFGKLFANLVRSRSVGLQHLPEIIIHPDHHVAFSIQATLPGAALQQILATHFNAKLSV